MKRLGLTCSVLALGGVVACTTAIDPPGTPPASGGPAVGGSPAAMVPATPTAPSGGAPAPSGGAPAPSGAAPAPSKPAAGPSLSVPQARAYLAYLAPTLVSRVLTSDEQKEIAASGQAAIPKLLTAWRKDPGLVSAARAFVDRSLGVGGTKDKEIDYALPSRIAAHVAAQDLPWSTILTSDTCYDAADKAIPCDTGAPYAAGVLTTRAYLAANVGRFNLVRARTMMNNFLCRGYPMEEELQPKLPRTSLITMFQAENPEEQKDPSAVNGFGNGFGCYTCHGQFGAHAQLFVKFDTAGKWIKTATGQQDPKGELGRSIAGLYTSHFADPAASASESTQMLSQKVQNLAEAVKLLVKQPLFVECSAEQVLRFGLDLDDSVPIDRAALTAIAAKARAGGDPSFAEIVFQIFTHPAVISSVVASLDVGGSR